MACITIHLPSQFKCVVRRFFQFILLYGVAKKRFHMLHYSAAASLVRFNSRLSMPALRRNFSLALLSTTPNCFPPHAHHRSRAYTTTPFTPSTTTTTTTTTTNMSDEQLLDVADEQRRLLDVSDEQRRLLEGLEYRDLQRLAKLHENIKGNQTKKELIRQLAEVVPSSVLSTRTTKWLPSTDENREVTNPTATTASTNDASDWLAPDDVDTSNRRVMKARPQVARELSSSSPALAGLLDPDGAEWHHDPLYGQPNGLETQVLTPMTVVENEPLTAEHIVYILAQNNARNIQQYHQVRTDAEHYIIASGLSLRHVRSLKEALVHAAKQTKIVGLSSSNIASGGRKSPLAHWEIIDLRETMIHIMTDQGRELYDLEGLWLNGITEQDMEGFGF